MRIERFFIWQTWIPITQGCFVTSLVEIDTAVLEKNFFNFVHVFLLFRNYLPLEEGGALHLNKLEFPSPKDALCQVWLKLAHLVQEKKIFFYFVNVFSLFGNYLPFGKGRGPSFEQIWIPFSEGCFVTSLVEIGSVVLEMKMKMWKVYNNDDDGQSSLSPSAQVSQ